MIKNSHKKKRKKFQIDRPSIFCSCNIRETTVKYFLPKHKNFHVNAKKISYFPPSHSIQMFRKCLSTKIFQINQKQSAHQIINKNHTFPTINFSLTVFNWPKVGEEQAEGRNRPQASQIAQKCKTLMFNDRSLFFLSTKIRDDFCVHFVQFNLLRRESVFLNSCFFCFAVGFWLVLVKFFVM